MADNLTDTAENLVLTWLFTASAATRPATPWTVALVTVAGSDSALGTEVVGGSYTRQAVTFGAASAGAIANSADIVFAGMPAATVVGVAVFENGGTRIAYGALSVNKTTNSGDTFTITTGNLSISLA
jgi:hypothetical protein